MNSITDRRLRLVVRLFITIRNARVGARLDNWNLYRAHNAYFLTFLLAYGFWLGQCHR